jgi:molybdopterin/thiamine biosynthesis adenylyltransferase
MDRHARQARLAGVGAEGQARIGRASVEVRLGGFAADVAARYLAGAGVGCLRVRGDELAAGARAIDAGVRVELDPSLGLADDQGGDLVDLDDASARDLARGALFALRALRAALEESS